MPSRRRHDEEEHENHERWLITYADMITLLLALFMMLYALSVLDLRKFESFREAFADEKSGTQAQGLPEDHNPAEGDPSVEIPGVPSSIVVASTVAVGDPPTADSPPKATTEQAVSDLEQQLRDAVAKAGLADKVSVERDDRGVIVFVTDGVLFNSGGATLLPDGQHLIDGLVPVLAGVGNQLDVQGHTDDRPINSAAFPSNWELSTARATSVLRSLIAQPGISVTRIGASGFADTRPRQPNDTPAGRSANRRVEIVVLVPTPLLPPSAPAAPKKAAAGGPSVAPAGHDVSGPRQKSSAASESGHK